MDVLIWARPIRSESLPPVPGVAAYPMLIRVVLDRGTLHLRTNTIVVSPPAIDSGLDAEPRPSTQSKC